MQNQSSNDDNDAAASRSDDPGQSSYGGFKNEGPADGKNHAEAEEGSDVGGIAQSSSKLGSRLSDGVNGEDDGGEDIANDDADADATSGVVTRDTQTPENRQG